MSEKKKKYKIAVVLASMSVEYAYDTLLGIEQAAGEHNADLYLFNSNATTDETLKYNIGEYNIYNLIDFDRFDGIILFANLIQGYSVYNNIIDKIRKSGLPTVSIDADIEGFYFVGVENYEPMKAVVNHLIEVHNYTDIACFAGQDFNTDNRERVAAFVDAMNEHNLEIKDNRIFKGAFVNIYGRKFAKQLLKDRDNMPQAVVCCTDSIAFGARTIFENNGIKMPDDLALSGFDNIFEARNTIPRLTTVSRNLDVVGREALVRIIDHINGKTVKMKERFKATPVYRESCGCKPKDQGDIISLKKKYLETSEKYANYLIESNSLMDTLTACTSYDEFIEKLVPFVHRVFDREFFLCLDKGFVKELTCSEGVYDELNDEYNKSGYPERMSVVIHMSNGQLMENFDFDSANMLPCEIEDGKNHSFIFVPIHFRDRCLGYAVMDDDVITKLGPIFATWFINLSNCFESLRKQIHLKNVVEYLDKQYVIDSLTGLYNRYGLDRFSKESFEKCKNEENTFMLLFADMDGLKTINDVYGHDQGDFAINVIADSLKKCCKKGEICARYGGDEFVVYAEKYSEKDADAFVDAFNLALEGANEEYEVNYKFQASCGYVIAIPDEGEVLSSYIDMADNCMYAQKIKRKQGLQN